MADPLSTYLNSAGRTAAPSAITGGGTVPGTYGVAGGGSPGRSLFGDITHYALGQPLHDIANMLIGSMGGAIRGTEYAFTHDPLTTLTQGIPSVAEGMYKGYVHDITHFRQDPFQAIFDVGTLLPIPGAALGRIGSVADLMARGTAMTPELAAAVAPKLAAGDVPGAMEIATKMGKREEFGRAVYQQGENAGMTRSFGGQLGRTLVRGAPQEGRLLRDPASGEEIPGWVFSKDPTIKASQKLIDNLYTAHFPGGVPPSILRIFPPFWYTQAGRVGRAERQLSIQGASILGASGRSYWRTYKNMPEDQQTAASLVLQGPTAEDAIRYHQDILNGSHPQVQSGKVTLSPANVAETNQRLDMLREAQKYLDTQTHSYRFDPGYVDRETGETGRILPADHPPVEGERTLTYRTSVLNDSAPTKLKEFIDTTRQLSRDREEVFKQLNKLSDESALSRTVAPLQEMLTGTLPLYGRELDRAKRRVAQLRGGARPGFTRLYRAGEGLWTDNLDLAKADAEASGAKIRSVDLPEHEVETYRAGGTDPLAQLQARFNLPRDIADEAKPWTEKKVENPQEVAQLGREIDTAENKPFIPQQVAEQLVKDANLARVHYEIPQKGYRSATVDFFRKAFTGQSEPSVPTTLTHPFEAAILRRGGGDANVARVQALSYTEAARYAALHRNWLRIVSGLRKNPEGIPERHRILVRDPSEQAMGSLTVAGRQAAEQMIERAQYRDMTPAEEAARGMQFEETRKGLFKNAGDKVRDLASGIESFVKDLAKEDVEAPYGYKWADERTLGGLNKQNPLIKVLHDYPVARKVVRGIDALNTANKMAILYLKPAYIFPNAMGNLFLNLIHQGFLAPWNLSRAVATSWRLDRETRDGLLGATGEGGIEAIGREAPGNVIGRFQRGARRVAAAYGKIVDEPFRLAAILHEAWLSGFSSPAELRALVTEKKLQGTFTDIAQRANDAIVNYEMLSPAEQGIMRRLIFFYPWIKGSTRLVGQQLKERPITTGLQAEVGKEQSRYVESVLGALPAYAEGITPFRKPNAQGQALIQNPMAMSIMGTPGHALNEVLNMFSSTPQQALAASQELSPADLFGLTLLTAGLGAGGVSVRRLQKTSPFKTAVSNYYSGIPLFNFAQQLISPKPAGVSVYPQSNLWTELSRIGLFGGLTPRPYDVPLAQYRAWQAENPR
jgi:hypothetical protein